MTFPYGHIPGVHIPGTRVPIGAVVAQQEAALAQTQAQADFAASESRRRKNHLLLLRQR